MCKGIWPKRTSPVNCRLIVIFLFKCGGLILNVNYKWYFLSALFCSNVPIFVVVLERIALIMNHEYSAIQPLPNDKECGLKIAGKMTCMGFIP